eukprot:gene19190-9256_t
MSFASKRKSGSWSVFSWVQSKRNSSSTNNESAPCHGITASPFPPPPPHSLSTAFDNPAYCDLAGVICVQPALRTRTSLFTSVSSASWAKFSSSSTKACKTAGRIFLGPNTSIEAEIAAPPKAAAVTSGRNLHFKLSARSAQHKKLRKQLSAKKAGASSEQSSLRLGENAAATTTPYDSGIESAESSEAEDHLCDSSSSRFVQARAPADHCFSKRRRASVEEIAYRWAISTEDAAELAANFESAQGQPPQPNRPTFASNKDQADHFARNVS